MQLEMVAEEKKAGMRWKVAKENMENDVWPHGGDGRGPEMGVDRKWTLQQTKAKMTQRQLWNKKIHTMYKTRQSLFTGCNGPVCAQHGCEYDVMGRRWRQWLAERETTWKQSLAQKWGTSDVAVPDTVDRGVGLPLLQIVGEERGWSRVDTEGSLERVKVSGGLTTDRSKYVGNHRVRLCTREKLLLWYSWHSDGVRSDLWCREEKRTVTRNFLKR